MRRRWAADGFEDTIAAIAGALAGALNGVDALPQSMYKTFCAANADDEFDIEELASGLTSIAIRREGGVS